MVTDDGWTGEGGTEAVRAVTDGAIPDGAIPDGASPDGAVIDRGVQDGAGRRVALVEVTESNWRDIADVVPHDEQRAFVPPSAARYLLLSEREGVWHSLGVEADGVIVGHVMWGWDDDDQLHWIGGVLVDAAEQGKGVGRAAMVTLIGWLLALPGATGVRLSYQPENAAARAMYAALGFVENDLLVDDEVVADLTAARAAPLL